jgi:quinol monooxygenase YgiN
MIVIITTTTVEVPEERDRLLSALAKATPPTLREPGVLEYRSSMAANDPSVVHAVEIYASVAGIVGYAARSSRIRGSNASTDDPAGFRWYLGGPSLSEPTAPCSSRSPASARSP